LCIQPCDGDEQCAKGKRCFCNDHQRCSVHVYDSVLRPDPHVCIIDEPFAAPDVQRALERQRASEAKD
jgi:hypothetical protein